MRRILCLISLFLSVQVCKAGHVYGTISESGGNPVSFASITVKGTTRGVAANSQGKYSLQLEPGNYTLVCQHVGYRSEEKTVTVGSADVIVDFKLSIQELKMEQ